MVLMHVSSSTHCWFALAPLSTDICSAHRCMLCTSHCPDCCVVHLQPYVPVFWYPWGQSQKMEAVMSSRRSLNPHIQAAIRQGQNGKNAQAAPMNGGNGETVV